VCSEGAMSQNNLDHDQSEDVLFGNFLSLLRWIPGDWTQAYLAKKAGIARSALNRYEKGNKRPREATFQWIREAAGVPQRLVSFLRWWHRLLYKALALGEVDTRPADMATLGEATRVVVWDIVERALALARAEHALLRSAPRRPGPPTEQDHQRVEALLEKLDSYPETKQRLLIQGAQAYRDPLLCLHICKKSETAASDDPVEALKLAEWALFVAQHVQGSDAFKTRLEGWCTGFIANAQRVIGRDLPEAETTFARTWRLWKQGADPAGLLSKANLLDKEASLRRAQRLFPRALKLHDDALELARPEEVGHFLLNKAFTLQHQGKHQEALQTLEKAAQKIDGERQPRLTFGVQFNRASNLLLLDRAGEAAPIVAEVRKLAERLRNDSDLVRTLWLEGNCAAGFGRKEEALTKLEQVRHEFDVRGNPFDYALASLDVALLYREEGRFPEIKILADEILAIFEAQKVHREAIAAVILFQEAAEKETVTAEMVRRLQDYLSKARSSPGLRF
jgi:transcriptional regulator with XRE-family HTH domain